MKKVLIFLIPLLICSWWYFRSDTNCSSCAAEKGEFYFIVSPPGKDRGVEKAAVALKGDYARCRVILWEQEVHGDIPALMEKYPYKFQVFKTSDKGLFRFYRLIHALPPEDRVVVEDREFQAGLFQQIKLEKVLAAKDLKELLSFMPEKLEDKPQSKRADLVVFSFDRPLQLYAYLESLEKFVKNVGQVSVIYRTSHPDFQKGYEVVKKRFPQFSYLLQGQKPKADFKPLVMKAAFKSKNSYILFAVDDIVIRDNIDIEECVDYLEKTGALAFYLRLGTNTTYCNGPQLKGEMEFQGVPPSFPINATISAWQFQDGKDDWRYPHNVDMTLYRKSDIRKDLEELEFNNPNTFECFWSHKARLTQVGLYYSNSKIVNLPLNLVNSKDRRHVGVYTAAQLLDKFKKGLKMNIEPLQQFQNCCAHADFDVTFIPRADE